MYPPPHGIIVLASDTRVFIAGPDCRRFFSFTPSGTLFKLIPPPPTLSRRRRRVFLCTLLNTRRSCGGKLSRNKFRENIKILIKAIAAAIGPLQGTTIIRPVTTSSRATDSTVWPRLRFPRTTHPQTRRRFNLDRARCARAYLKLNTITMWPVLRVGPLDRTVVNVWLGRKK